MRQVFGIDQLAVIVVGPQADLIGIRSDRADPNVVEHFSISCGGRACFLNAAEIPIDSAGRVAVESDAIRSAQ